MIPFLTSTAWRAGAAIALVVAVALMGWRVSVWRESHHALQAAKNALAASQAEVAQCAAREASAWQALREAEGKAQAREAADRATAERIEHELQTKLAAADARGRDLARRLLDATRAARSGAGPVSGAAGAAGQPARAAGEPGSPDALGAATADLIGACERDAARLGGWQSWWAEVGPGRQRPKEAIEQAKAGN